MFVYNQYNGGTQKPTITNSYYNGSLYSKRPSATTATMLTTAQFADKTKFTNWDFTNTWIIKDGYPELRIFLTPAEIAQLGG